MNSTQELPGELLDQFGEALYVEVFTGVAALIDIGIPMFHDRIGLLWQEFDGQRHSISTEFEKEPSLVRTWYRQLKNQVQTSQPSVAHVATTDLNHRAMLNLSAIAASVRPEFLQTTASGAIKYE